MKKNICPQCGAPLPDGENRCEKCGFEIVNRIFEEQNNKKDNSKKIFCHNCGVEMNIDDDFCPNCECKSLHKETKINYKKILVVGGIVVIISAAVFGCVKHFNGKHDVKENYPQAYADLKQTLTDGLELVDDCSQLVERTWHYAEAQQFNEDTYEYSVSEDGEFFSSKKALKNLYDDGYFQESLEEIHQIKEECEELLPDVKYAPKEYKRRNNAIHELYDAFLDMTELVEKPKGNISKYQEKYRKVHRDLVNAAQEFIESEEEE